MPHTPTITHDDMTRRRRTLLVSTDQRPRSAASRRGRPREGRGRSQKLPSFLHGSPFEPSGSQHLEGPDTNPLDRGRLWRRPAACPRPHAMAAPPCGCSIRCLTCTMQCWTRHCRQKTCCSVQSTVNSSEARIAEKQIGHVGKPRGLGRLLGNGASARADAGRERGDPSRRTRTRERFSRHDPSVLCPFATPNADRTHGGTSHRPSTRVMTHASHRASNDHPTPPPVRLTLRPSSRRRPPALARDPRRWPPPPPGSTPAAPGAARSRPPCANLRARRLAGRPPRGRGRTPSR